MQNVHLYVVMRAIFIGSGPLIVELTLSRLLFAEESLRLQVSKRVSQQQQQQQQHGSESSDSDHDHQAPLAYTITRFIRQTVKRTSLEGRVPWTPSVDARLLGILVTENIASSPLEACNSVATGCTLVSND